MLGVLVGEARRVELTGGAARMATSGAWLTAGRCRRSHLDGQGDAHDAAVGELDAGLDAGR